MYTAMLGDRSRTAFRDQVYPSYYTPFPVPQYVTTPNVPGPWYDPSSATSDSRHFSAQPPPRMSAQSSHDRSIRRLDGSGLIPRTPTASSHDVGMSMGSSSSQILSWKQPDDMDECSEKQTKQPQIIINTASSLDAPASSSGNIPSHALILIFALIVVFYVVVTVLNAKISTLQSQLYATICMMQQLKQPTANNTAVENPPVEQGTGTSY